MKDKFNPYDASNGGFKALIKKSIKVRFPKGSPYNAPKVKVD